VKKYFLVLLAIVLVIVLLLSGCAKSTQSPATAPAQVPEGGKGSGVRYSAPPMEYQGEHERSQFLTQEVILPYVKGLEDKSGWKLKILYYDRDTEVKNTALMDGIASNAVQMGTVVNVLEPGRYPLTEVVSLPFIAPSSTIASLVAWHLHEQFPEWQAQFPAEVKVLSHFVSASSQIHTVDKPIKSVADLEGMKVMALNAWGIKVLEKVGAIPQQVLIADIYGGLEKGMAEGVLCPLTTVRTTNVSEVAKHHTVINLNYDMFTIPINGGVFEKLPAELQQIIVDESGAKLAEDAGKAMDESALIDSNWMIEQGATFHQLPEAEMAKLTEMVMPIQEDWVAEMEAKGLPGRAILEEALRYSDELAAQGKFVPEYPTE